MAFLQELRSAINTALLELNNVKDVGGDDTEPSAKYTALLEIWNWVLSGAWSPHKDFVTRVICLITNDRDTAIKELGLTSVNHANTLLYRANAALEKQVGSGIVKSILAGDINSAMLQFRLKTGTTLSDTAFMQDVRVSLPEASGSTRYKLGDCVKEAKFLAFYSKALLEKRLASLDMGKLAYLVYLLDTYDPALLSEAAVLSKVVSGEVSAESLVSVTNPTNEVYR